MSHINNMNHINNNLSIFIPVVEKNVAYEKYFTLIFHNLNLGYVKRVDFIEKENNYQAFVHFHEWYKNMAVNNLHQRILENNGEGEGRVVYDDPKYWILRKNNNPIPDNYALEISNIKNLQEKIYQDLNNTINQQELSIKQLNWWIKLHEANIGYLTNEIKELKKVKNYSEC